MYVLGMCIFMQCGDYACRNHACRSNELRFIIVQSFQCNSNKSPQCSNCPFSNTASFLLLLVHQQMPFSFLASPLIGHRKNFPQYIQWSSYSDPNAKMGHVSSTNLIKHSRRKDEWHSPRRHRSIQLLLWLPSEHPMLIPQISRLPTRFAWLCRRL